MPRGVLRSVLAFAGLLIASLVPNAHAQCVDYQSEAHWLGTATTADGVHGVATMDHFAFAAAGLDGLLTFDLSDPTNPRALARNRFARFATDALLLYHDRLVVLFDDGGMALLDVTTPAQPRLLETTELGRSGFQLARTSVWVLAAGGAEGLLRAQLDSSGRLVAAAAFPIPGTAYGLAVDQGFAFVAAGSAGMVVLDVRTPEHPRLVAAVPTGGLANGIAVQGKQVLLADSTKGLLLWDVTDPVSPRSIGSAAQPFPTSVKPFLTAERAYVPAEEGGLRVFTRAGETPLAPLLTLAGSGGRAHCVKVGGSSLLFGDDAGLWTTGSDLTTARVAGNSMRARSAPTRLDMDGHSALLLEPGLGVELLTVDDAGDIVRQSWWDDDEIEDAVLAPPYVYMATMHHGLSVLDVSDRLAPRLVYEEGDRRELVARWGERLITAVGAGQAIYDLSDPASPRKIGTRVAPFGTRGLIALPSGRYLSIEPDAIELIDAKQNPSQPTTLWRKATPTGIGRAARVDDDHLLLTWHEGWGGDGTSVVEVIDMRNGLPVSDGALTISGAVTGLECAPPLAYAVGEESGLTLLDLTDRSHPRRVGYWSRGARQLATAGERLVLATADALVSLPGDCDAHAHQLPSDLEANALLGRTELLWSADPGDFDHFEVERAPIVASEDHPYETISLDRPVPGAGPFRFLDLDVRPGTTYAYRVVGIRADGERYPVGPIRSTAEESAGVTFFSPTPNPAHREVTVRYFLPMALELRATLFDVSGRQVKEWRVPPRAPGGGQIVWTGENEAGREAPTGAYFLRLSAGRFLSTQRVLWIR
ncbi:MAG: hypothetical protein U0527_17260 [Candidatus Eisenbacteria bacterium]